MVLPISFKINSGLNYNKLNKNSKNFNTESTTNSLNSINVAFTGTPASIAKRNRAVLVDKFVKGKRKANKVGQDIKAALQTIDMEIDAIRMLRRDLLSDQKQFSKAVDLILGARRKGGHVIVSGVGKSGDVGRKLEATLTSIRVPSFFIDPLNAGHGDLGKVTRNDVLIVISNSGKTRELKYVLDGAKSLNVPIIGITKDENSKLGQQSRIVLRLPKAKEACTLGVAPTSSTTATLVLGDCLTIALMKRMRFSLQEFFRVHCAGSIGSNLKKLIKQAHDPKHAQ